MTSATGERPPEVRQEPDRHRFEIVVDDAVVGLTEYRERSAGSYAFIHTEVDPAFGGRGLAGILVGAAMGSMAEQGIGVLPYCPFVRQYLIRHPDLQHLVPADRRAEFGLPG